MTTWDDPVVVAEQYRDDADLRARQALCTLEVYRQSLSYEPRPLPAQIPFPFRVHGRTTIFVAAT